MAIMKLMCMQSINQKIQEDIDSEKEKIRNC